MGAASQIFFYDGNSVRQLTDNDSENHDPQINNGGHIAWKMMKDGLR